MANLSDLAAYLRDRIEVLGRTEDRLESLQQKFESFHSEVVRAREHELDQLVDITVSREKELPEDFVGAVATHRVSVEREFAERIHTLALQREELQKETEALRILSARSEKELHNKNRALDAEEESLKARNADLLRRIEAFNGRISDLGRSFGFFTNFFRMRRLAEAKASLDEEQRDVAARIEDLRGRWRNADEFFQAAEAERREKWIVLETDAAARAAKIEALEARRLAIVARTTVERVLRERDFDVRPAEEGDPLCPRCSTANPAANAFCHLCANRLGEDRPDFAGSLDEFAELDRHFHRFSEAMKAGQEIIGLVRGLKSGLESLLESVDDMIGSQTRHSLAELTLEVPQWSRDFGQRFEDIHRLAQEEMGLRPLDFSTHIAQQVELVFTEENITAFFELIGQQMSDSAEAQW